MRRYIVLLLITGIVWAQTDFDILVLKSGTTYLGEYSKIEGEIVYFKPQNAFALQPISIEKIRILQLKDGQFIIEDGKDILTYEKFQKESLEENQKKITVEEKAIVILKTVSGKEYKGKYLKTEGGKVFFIPEGANSPTQVVPVKLIKKLQLKEGPFIILDGRNRLILEEYQKFSTKEKAIYDAKSKNLVKWALYGPTSIIIFMGSTFLHKDLMGGEFWESPIFLRGSSAASLTIPYFVLNRKEKFNFPKSILTDSEKEIYEQTYSKRLKGRKINYIVGSVAVTGILVYLMFMNAMSGLDLDFGSSTAHSTAW